jgi:hypothetical protein
VCVILLYAGAHKISLKYLFPEKMFIEVCCKKKKKLNIYTRILDIMKLIEQIHFMVVK